jgi:anaerobic magnesium-protoporphyrin IX monomethyl ester cyclase
MIDVCLLKSPDSGLVYQNLRNEFTAIEVPVWAAVTADFLRKRNFSVYLLDAEAENLSIEEAAIKVADINARLTVFVVYGHQPSASSQRMPDAIAVHKILKEISATKTMFLGTHPAALPIETLEETKADFVCDGEGPFTITDLLNCLKSGDVHDFKKVRGLHYWDGGNISKTESVPLISNLDEVLPSAAWDLLSMKNYRAHNWHCFNHINERKPYASLYTSFGCPFKCSFCCINAPFGKSTIRYLSPQAVIKEIDILVNQYGIKNIKIPDEMFVLHKNHVIGICDLIIERGYDLNIWAYARIDTVQDSFLDKMKQAGIHWLALGIESGSEFVRDGALKALNGDDIIKTVKTIQSHGIAVNGNYIFGLPDDTHQTMEQTIQLAMELNTEWANFYCGMSYPGSPLHKMSRGKGILPEDPGGPGWIGYSQHAYETYPLCTDHLARGEILKFRDEAHLRFFNRPEYYNMIGSKYGDESRQHVEKMNKMVLQRKYIGEKSV